jgi:hypothetical protein
MTIRRVKKILHEGEIKINKRLPRGSGRKAYDVTIKISLKILGDYTFK